MDGDRLDDATLRRFVFQTFGRSRRTQDSPVMPDVWLRYIRVAERIAQSKREPRSDGSSPSRSDSVDLLLTPWSGVRPGEIANLLRRWLIAAALGPGDPPRIAFSDSRVVVNASFDTLVCYLVPLSNWWRDSLRTCATPDKKDEDASARFKDILNAIVKEAEAGIPPSGVRNELSRYSALVGFISLLKAASSIADVRKLAALAYRLGPPPDDRDMESDGEPGRLPPEMRPLLVQLYEQAGAVLAPSAGRSPGDNSKGLYLISLNRPASQSLFDSRSTVKADAAHRVFAINTAGIVFAVIDGGIDATHPAFHPWSDDDRKRIKESNESKKSKVYPDNLNPADSRIKKTYDFTLVRDIIAYTENPVQVEKNRRKRIEDLFNKHKDEGRQKDPLLHMQIRNANARDMDWELVSPLIEIPHVAQNIPDKKDEPDTDRYRIPGTDHGTHVAGILAADFPVDPDLGKELLGMCPQLALYDLRVFDANGRGDEFAILCALEFVGWLNRDRSNPVVHGVNLSLALAHDVDSFACGQTPICEACNHLVGAGTVVVAAAGNTGFEGKGPERQSLGSGYRAISITDPGNADNVITVGSTHRRDPHLYGVSYFSARGPTGDGRRKPDLLAPGEKITSTIRGGQCQRMDGTSMAAPHVSGAAAMLMARYPELIGRPAKIKEILLATTTDLGREASFQGAGLVDVLRALQSV
jgi:serine protease AprX